MKKRMSLSFTFILIALGLFSIYAKAQDTLKVNSNSVTLRFENDRLRVLEIVIKPGIKDKEHSHPNYATYVVSGGKFRVHSKTGVSVGEFKTGDVLFRDARTHWAENIGKTTIRLILLELKDNTTRDGSAKIAPPYKDTLKVNPGSVTLKFENDQVRVLQSVLKPGVKENEHSHPDYVTYAVSGGKVRNHTGDTASFGEFKDGEVLFRDARTHWSENIGKTTIRVIMFELKD